jgi:hypothetical protein
LDNALKSFFHPTEANKNFTLLEETTKKENRGINLNEKNYRVIFNDRYVGTFASAPGGCTNQTMLLSDQTHDFAQLPDTQLSKPYGG